ncbi:MAG: cbb3-type cytochrome c oxidase N-terminal domain-containing protein [Planctomycetota bacterium]
MSHDPKLLEHEYDGIREFDNPTPGWWHALFFLFVIFGVFYMVLTTGSPMYDTPKMSHEKHKLAWITAKFGEIGELAPDEATLVRYYADPSEQYAERWMPYAASLFKANCVSCHGANGEGSVGPNLTDDAYISVASITDIYDVIQNGANAGAMPAWGTRFHPNEVILLSSYVASMRGQNLPGLPPDGDVPEPWPTLAEIAGSAPDADAAEPGNEQASAAAD